MGFGDDNGMVIFHDAKTYNFLGGFGGGGGFGDGGNSGGGGGERHKIFVGTE